MSRLTIQGMLRVIVGKLIAGLVPPAARRYRRSEEASFQTHSFTLPAISYVPLPDSRSGRPTLLGPFDSKLPNLAYSSVDRR